MPQRQDSAPKGLKSGHSDPAAERELLVQTVIRIPRGLKWQLRALAACKEMTAERLIVSICQEAIAREESQKAEGARA